MAKHQPRLYLMSPPVTDAAEFLGALEPALASGEVACVMLSTGVPDEAGAKKIIRTIAASVQASGAALIVDRPDLAARADADGAHVRGQGEQLERLLDETIESLKPERIVGAGGFRSRHDAMTAGERDVDYIFFGEPGGDGWSPPLDDLIERVEWWAEVFNVPCVAYAASLDDVAPLTAAGADFIALREAVWSDPRGAVAAVADAARLLAGIAA